MCCKQPFSKMDIIPSKFSENYYLSIKIGTDKVFAIRKSILPPDFDNFKPEVNDNAMFSGQNRQKIVDLA